LLFWRDRKLRIRVAAPRRISLYSKLFCGQGETDATVGNCLGDALVGRMSRCSRAGGRNQKRQAAAGGTWPQCRFL